MQPVLTVENGAVPWQQLNNRTSSNKTRWLSSALWWAQSRLVFPISKSLTFLGSVKYRVPAVWHTTAVSSGNSFCSQHNSFLDSWHFTGIFRWNQDRLSSVAVHVYFLMIPWATVWCLWLYRQENNRSRITNVHIMEQSSSPSNSKHGCGVPC